jgi:regulatory protein
MPEAGTVTAIRPQTRDPERVNVYIEDEFAFGLNRQIVVDEGLRPGDVLDADRIQTLRAADEVSKATNAALNLLALRPRSIREVRDRLRDKGYDPETIDAAIAKLEGWSYIDDADFARFWVENRVTHKPRVRRLLEQELWRKGVDRETARHAIDQSELDEYEAALTIAKVKIRSYVGLNRDVAYRRLGGVLARRGFAYDVVKPVLDRIFNENPEIIDNDPA